MVTVVSIYLGNVQFICSNSHDSSFTYSHGLLDQEVFSSFAGSEMSEY